MKRWLLEILLICLVLLFLFPCVVFAGTTADITITGTPSFISIAVSPSTYDFGSIAASSVTNSTSSYFTLINNCSVSTNVAIAVTGANWTGGTQWLHSDTATIGADTAGLLSNKGGTWGTSDVIVKNAAPNNIAAAQAANTNFTFGLSLLAPSSFSDGTQKTNTVRLTASST